MASFFEIIELSNGDVALRRIDEPEGEDLVTVHFSDDAKASLSEHHMEVARVMLEAAVRRVGELSGMEITEKDVELVSPGYSIH